MSRKSAALLAASTFGQAQRRKQNRALVAGETIENDVCAVARVNGNVRIDQIRQSSVALAQRNSDRHTLLDFARFGHRA